MNDADIAYNALCRARAYARSLKTDGSRKAHCNKELVERDIGAAIWAIRTIRSKCIKAWFRENEDGCTLTMFAAYRAEDMPPVGRDPADVAVEDFMEHWGREVGGSGPGQHFAFPPGYRLGKTIIVVSQFTGLDV